MSEHGSPDPKERRRRRLPNRLGGFEILTPLVLLLAFIGLLILIYFLAP